MDVIPDENLPAAAMAWGKDMTRWRRDLSTRVDRNELDNSNTLGQLNSQVQLLSKQVRDIIGRKTIMRVVIPTNAYSGVFNVSGVSFSDPTIGPLAKTITIADNRTVIVRMIPAARLGTQTAVSYAVFIDGIQLAAGHPSLITGDIPGWNTGAAIFNSPLATPTSTDNLWVTTVAEAIFNLKAGTHTIETRFWGSSTASGGSLRWDSANMVIEVQGIVPDVFYDSINQIN